MANQNTPLKFDHREIAVIFSLFIFVSLLMFTVGIVVGKGLSQAKYEAVLLRQQPVAAGAETAAGHSTHPPAGTHITTPSPKVPTTPDTGRNPADHKEHSEHGKTAPENEHVNRVPNDEGHQTEPATKEPLKLIPKDTVALQVSSEALDLSVDPNNESKAVLENPRLRNIIEGMDKETKKKRRRKRKTSSLKLPSSFAKGAFTVQVGSYPTKKDAVDRIAKLKKIGFPHAYLSVKKFGSGKETWYRVWLGYFPNVKGAKQSGEYLQKKGDVSNYLVRKSDQSG